MIQYDYPLFRPPSEANSLIIQATIGCSHNRCLFCYMYKGKIFRIRPLKEIEDELKSLSLYYQPRKIFIADGDLFAAETSYIVELLNLITRYFPNVNRISSYGSALSVIKKSEREILEIKSLGLSLVYIGIESGDDEVLKFMNKGSSVRDNIDAVLKLKKCGIKTSVMAILGLGGRERTKEHAVNTGAAISLMNPDYFSTLTLLVDKISPLYRFIEKGDFHVLNDDEIIVEHISMIEKIEGKNIIFRSNHASNVVSIGGVLSRDKNEIISVLENCLRNKDYRRIRLL